MKRIVICADGTWNKPEENLEKDYPTNVLKFSRAIAPLDNSKISQTVFYDWGIGSYHDNITGGAFGAGLNKNIQDCYRYIIHNYEIGDELYFFGFSRGAYTVRSLCGLINNCSILKREHANRISEGFDLYKSKTIKPKDKESVQFRKNYAVADKTKIHFLGVWDTVGTLGLPISFFGLIKEKHLFHDNKIGSIVKTARHALSLDEKRKDFKPTIWEPKPSIDLKQVWFAGVHSDIGGGYAPDKFGNTLADIPMTWIKEEAQKSGLTFEKQINEASNCATAVQHEEYKSHFTLLGKYTRKIPKHTFIHQSVKERYLSNPKYRPVSLTNFLKDTDWDDCLNS